MDRGKFFAALRRRGTAVFGTSLSQGQVDGINGLLDAFVSHGDGRVKTLAYPDKMLDPVISARVLFKGLLDGRWNGKGKGIAFYLPSNGPDDLKNARRTVNVTDKWQIIGGYYAAFLAAIREAGGVPIAEPKTPDPVPAPAPTELAKLRIAAPGEKLPHVQHHGCCQRVRQNYPFR